MGDCMRRLFIVVALGLVLAAPAAAQFTQYFAPGSMAETEDPLEKQIKQAMEQARWHLGPIRLQPWIGLRNLGYIDNVYGTETNKKSDFTASAGAGLRGYLPLGGKTVLFARALPEYVWWKDIENRRTWTGRYSAGGYVFFNRLTVQAYANRLDQQTVINAELETPITHRFDSTALSLDLRFFRRLSVVASGSRNKLRIDTSDLEGGLQQSYEGLERDEDVVRLGLRYTFSENLAITLGGQRSEVEFVQPIFNRSNTGDGVYAVVSFSGARVGVSINGAIYSVEPKGGSQFTRFESTTGQASVGYRLTERMQWQLYGGRSLVYSIGTTAPYYTDTRLGTNLSTSLGWRATARIYYEKGTFGYPVVGSGTLDRDYEGYGVGVSAIVFRGVSLGVTASRSNFMLGNTTRSVTRVQTTLGLAGAGLSWW